MAAKNIKICEKGASKIFRINLPLFLIRAHPVTKETGSVKVLLLIPHRLADDRHEAVRRGDRPQADYDALAEAVCTEPGGQADILDWHSVEQEGGSVPPPPRPPSTYICALP